MLSDLERKILRILWNVYRESWASPDMERFCRLSGRKEKQVREAIKNLRDAGFIEVRPGEFRVIEGWERRPQSKSNLSIFTE